MKTVIEMARKAGIEWDLIDEDEGQVWYITQAGLERFADLVAAAEHEAIIDLVAMYGGSVDLEAAIRARGNT